jgi:hypothetical protein
MQSVLYLLRELVAGFFEASGIGLSSIPDGCSVHFAQRAARLIMPVSISTKDAYDSVREAWIV